ncbi:MAG: T9SS type A sorting domain-containing protein [bacterium]|nr:T9SS type A sorting domain-containing protein [bacterium]
MMKAIFCLAIVICYVGVLNAQPLHVEWERTLHVSNDSLRGFGLFSILEQSESRSLYLFGQANTWAISDDSSDAVVMRVGQDGDSLWARFYDREGSSLYWFGPAAQLPTGELVTAVYWPTLYYLDLAGNVYDSTDLTCESNWLGSVEELAVDQDGRTYIGARCVVIDDVMEENAVLTCIDEHGDSLWSVVRSYAQYNTVSLVVPAIGGGVFSIFERSSWPYQRYLLAIDSNGNLISESEIPSRAFSVIAVAPDTAILVYSTVSGELTFRKFTTDGQNLVERTYNWGPQYTSRLIFELHNNWIEMRSMYGLFAGISFSLDSLWSFQLADSVGGFPVHRREGGYVSAGSINSPSGYYVHLVAYSEPRLPVFAIDNNIDFESVEIGEESVRQIEIINPGDSVLVQAITLPGGFSTNTTTPFWIHFDETETMSVTFAPTHVSSFVDTVYVSYDGPGSPIRIAVWASGTMPVSENGNSTPESFALLPAYPNPFNPSTSLTFTVAHESDVQLNVFNVQGRLVSEVVHRSFAVGQHSVNWSCAECASGIYFATMNVGTFTASQKLLLLK